MSDFEIYKLIQYLINTTNDQWCVKIVRTKDDKQNCIFGHIFNYGAVCFPNLHPDQAGNKMWDLFEASVGVTNYVYTINDGVDKKYNQPTPKQRCINYLYNIILGVEKRTEHAIGYCLTKNSYQQEH